MTITRNLYQRFQHYRTLRTDHISSLPIAILMPHSACNCRCVMCDIWKGNDRLKQLTTADLETLLISLKKLGTKQVVLSGGEALLNPNFFELCNILRKERINISLLSTGLSLARHAQRLIDTVQDIIVSLDGDGPTHNSIRNIPNAFKKLAEGIESIKSIQPHFRITSRTVIHRLNFRVWPEIINTARNLGIDQVSFLPADISSTAFNREIPWGEDRQQDILIKEEELDELQFIIDSIKKNHTRFIAEGPDKLQKIHQYYAAFYGKALFPYKRCNAPWVSTVVEADGTVRPCFFQEALGNIHQQSLDKILNSEKGVGFRKQLNIDTDPICQRCVCSLNYKL